jgi:HD superfamily phosphohydrolase
MRQLRPLILSKAKKELKQEDLLYPFSQDLIGNTICADLIDYLQRDHLYTGLPISLGHRYMSGFYVTPKGDSQLFPSRMALNIHRGGGERRDIVSELLKHLRYRYELQERVIVHHAKLAADAMVGKMLEMLHDALWAESATTLLDPPCDDDRHSPSSGDESDLAKIRREVERDDKANPARIDHWVKDRLEDLFLSAGDDGLLEHLRDANKAHRRGRRQAVAEIATELLDRKLFGLAARVKGAKAADELYEKFSVPDRRQELERRAAEYAELSDGWKVVIWLPKPTMRLKQAEVLVDHGEGISRLVDYSSRGREIYDDHKALWSVSVFVHSDVTAEEKLWVLAYLSKEMQVHWEDHEHTLGNNPDQAPEHLAALRACAYDRRTYQC